MKIKGLANIIVVHPFLLAVYITVHLFITNLGYIPGCDLIGSIGFMLAWVILSWLFWTLIFRNLSKAAVVTTLITLLFWGYMPIYDFVTRRAARVILNSDSTGFAEQLLHHRYLLVGAFIFTVALAVYMSFSKRSFRRTNITLNWIAAVMVLMTMPKLAENGWTRITQTDAYAFKSSLPPKIAYVEPASKPDIYYLIFDRFASTAVASNYFNCDISDLDAFLEQQGFYVLKTHCNYLGTSLSLASSLNLQYWDNNITSWPKDVLNGVVLDAFQRNRVALFLRKRGYAYIHIGSFWPPTSQNAQATKNICYQPIKNSLTASLMMQSILAPYYMMRYQPIKIASSIQALKDSVVQPGPKLVFAHFLLPHEPYCFKADGTLLSHTERSTMSITQQYSQQLLFTRDQIKSIVESIMQKSARPPIIVLQSDEGPRVEANYIAGHLPAGSQLPEDPVHIQGPILDALYLPGFDYARLRTDMTPVNTFRLIFAHYFSAQLEQLADRAPVSYLDMSKQSEKE